MHPYFVITEPQDDPPKVVAVNITNYAPNKDQTVILESGHAAITKKSVVSYRDTLFFVVEEIEKEINDGECRTMIDNREPICSETLLKTLRKGLKLSTATPIKFKRYCKDLF
jgi:hypothetical protein